MKHIGFSIRNYSWLWIPLAATFVQLLYFLTIVDTDGSLSLLTKISTSAADSLIIYFIFIFLPARINKYIIWLPGLLVTIFCIANSIYLAAFSDLFSFQSLSLISTIDHLVINSAVSLLSIREGILLLPYIAEVSLVYLISKRNWLNLPPQIKILYSSLLFLCLLSFSFLSVRRAGIYMGAQSLKQRFMAYADSWNLQTTNSGYYRMFGFNGYLMRSLIMSFHKAVPLSDKEYAEISDLFIKNSVPHEQIKFYNQRNKEKNLILIVVESLTSDILTTAYTPVLMPVISSLIVDSTAIVALNVKPQIGPGRSSDAQFIYNTGLLPLRREALIEKYASANYPSLAKALSRKINVEVIGESKSMWKHSLTTLSYGFDTIYDNSAGGNSNADKKIFDEAIKIIETLPRPFFLFLTTLSMHDPYDRPAVDYKIPIPNEITDTRDKNYLIAAAAFDLWLGEFLKSLRKKGVYDNSVIVIISDHEPKRQFLSEKIKGAYIPAIILNSGYGKKIDRQVKQIDLFPTILDVMGVETYNMPAFDIPYRGIGPGMINTSLSDSLPHQELSEETLYTASERLIQSGVFQE